MALDIFKLSGSIQVDTGPAEAGLKRVDDAAKRTGGSLDAAGKTSDDFSRNLSGLSNSLSSVGSAATTLGAILSTSVTLPLIGAAGAAISVATKMDSLTRGLRAVTGSTQ